MSVMSRNALHTPLMVLLQAVHTLRNFSKWVDWVLRMPRDGLTIPYRIPTPLLRKLKVDNYAHTLHPHSMCMDARTRVDTECRKHTPSGPLAGQHVTY